MKLLTLAALMALSFAVPAFADSASHDWNSSEGFPSDNANANRFNAAQALWIMGHGGSTTNVINTMNSTTNCTIQAACMYGGEVSNLNGVTSTTINNASGITVDNNVHTTGTSQTGSAVPVSADDIHSINFN